MADERSEESAAEAGPSGMLKETVQALVREAMEGEMARFRRTLTTSTTGAEGDSRSERPQPPKEGLGTMPPGDALEDIPTADPPTPAASQPAATAAAAAAFWENLLPVGGGTKKPDHGVCVGEALPPVPSKLAERICRWEYVDMAELLPEFWPQKGDENETAQRSGSARRKRPITSLNTWLQCYAVYVGVMSRKHPEAVPELMAYMVAIIRASEDYSGLAWVRYDAAYRRQAAASGNHSWSRINPSLYSLCFTGKAQVIKRCDLCLATSHETKECSLAADVDPDLPARLKAVESAVVAFAQSSPVGGDRRAAGGVMRNPMEVCRSWNEKRCFFRRCRYRHVCLTCGGAHPATDCPQWGRQSGGPERKPPFLQRPGPY